MSSMRRQTVCATPGAPRDVSCGHIHQLNEFSRYSALSTSTYYLPASPYISLMRDLGRFREMKSRVPSLDVSVWIERSRLGNISSHRTRHEPIRAALTASFGAQADLQSCKMAYNRKNSTDKRGSNLNLRTIRFRKGLI